MLLKPQLTFMDGIEPKKQKTQRSNFLAGSDFITTVIVIKMPEKRLVTALPQNVWL